MKKEKIYRCGIGQDSHRFLPAHSSKVCMLGGITFENVPGFQADSDGDVVYHALCNAISSVSGVSILGKIAQDLCKNRGITDSEVFLREAKKTLNDQKISHIAISIEGKKPHLQNKIDQMREKIAQVLNIQDKQIGITVTSGDGLTSYGKGEGVQCFCIVTTVEG